MSGIINLEEAIKIVQNLRKRNKSVVLAGGCFDVLHTGHIEFLQAAKKQGDVLFVLLESDEKIKQIKGPDRPINTQSERALILSHLRSVDYVIPISLFKSDTQYDDLTSRLKPDIIATTKGDPYKVHKERQASLISAHVREVIERIPDHSTSNTVTQLKKKNI